MEQVTYDLMVSPVKTKTFEEYSKEDARIYFDWYVAQSEKRINQLIQYCSKTSSSEIAFDETPNSLIPVWAWFEEQITTQKKTESEMQAALQGRPLWVQEEIKKVDWRFTTLTRALAIDMSFYFAQVMMKNHPSVKWGYFTKPKNQASVNRPVLFGFIKKKYMDPRNVIIVCCRHSVEKKDANRLYDLYMNWLEFIDVQ